MNKSESETLIEISSNSTVSSTIKKIESDDSYTFNASERNRLVNNKTPTNLQLGSSKKMIQSQSCFAISTTQVTPAESQGKISSEIDAATSSSSVKNNNNHNISNPDTTTVQGNNA